MVGGLPAQPSTSVNEYRVSNCDPSVAYAMAQVDTGPRAGVGVVNILLHLRKGSTAMSTIRDVARIAGVSISTVSLTLNDPDRVSAETKRKVADAAREVGHTANPIAQSLKRGKSRLIGMVVADITNPFFGQLLLEVERCAMEVDYLVIVSDTGGREASEKAFLAHLSGLLVSGIILSPCGLYHGPADHIAKLNMPFVLFDHKLNEVQSDFVGTDNILASAMLTEHLIRLGHTRIGCIGGNAGLYTDGPFN